MLLHKNVKKIFLLITLLVLFLSSFHEAYADTLGQRVNFNVNSEFDKYNRTSLNATLRHVGDWLYIYVEDSYWGGLNNFGQNSLMANIKVLADAFDNNIYPKEIATWGSEPNPGVDGDPRITILLEEMTVNRGGYFETANSYPKAEARDSNEREMVSLNVEVLLSDSFLEKVFLAHEFQHLISFNQKEKILNLSEDVWLNELRSEYSVSLAGYNYPYQDSNLEHRVQTFSDNRSDSLTEWPNNNLDYAMAALFAEYLAEQFGTNILSDTLKSHLVGIPSLNKYLTDKGYSDPPAGGFSDIFINWLGALYLNDVSKNEKLGYKRTELKNIKVAPQQEVHLSSGLPEYSSTQYIKDWQPLWLEFNTSDIMSNQAKSAKIDISGEAGQSFIASYLAFHQSGQVELGKINLISGRGSSYVLNSIDRLDKVVVLATKSTKISGFGQNETSGYLNVRVSMVDTKNAEAQTLKDGVLIKRPREKEIYVIWGKYKRYLNPGVISLYGHLDPANAIELEPEVFNSYQTANYVKYINEEKVYAVWPDATKHWMHITPQQWDDSSRDWNAIFTINDLELNYYKTGVDITR